MSVMYIAFGVFRPRRVTAMSDDGRLPRAVAYAPFFFLFHFPHEKTCKLVQLAINLSRC